MRTLSIRPRPLRPAPAAPASSPARGALLPLAALLALAAVPAVAALQAVAAPPAAAAVPASAVLPAPLAVAALRAISVLPSATAFVSLAAVPAPAAGPAVAPASAAAPASSAAPPSAAAPPPRRDAQNAYEPRTTPGAGQELLVKFAGRWDVVKTFYPQQGDPVRTSGECEQKMVHDGHFLQSDFVFFDAGGGRTTGTGISGFDPRSGRFTTVWFDSRGTTMSLRQSEGAFDGKEIVLYGAGLDGDRPARRSVTRAHLEEDGRVLVHRHYLIQDGGKERLMMELRLTRK